MACGNNGCNGNIVTNKLLDSNGLTYLKNLFNGKLFSIWGSLTAKGEKPINVEQSIGTAGETIVTVSVDEAGKDEEGNYTSGVMSASDKEKLDGISVSGVKEGNGLSVDAEGNISMGLATQTAAGAMSATDKEKLDSLSTDVATDEKNGLMSKDDKAALDALTSDVKVEFDNPRVLFTNDLWSTTVTARAYKGGAQVAIEDWDGLEMIDEDFANCVSTTGKLSNGEIQVTITRKAYLKPMSGTMSLVNVGVGGKTYSPRLSVASADNAITVLQGMVMPNYPEDDQLEATLWTFDGAKPTVRFLRKGTYWVNLPSSWQSALGNYDTTRLNVQVTMGGKADGSIVYCGRYSPGEEYNGDKASTDCWAAVLVLMRDISNEAVDAGFYITVSYVPSVGTYVATREEEETDDDDHTVDYGELTAELSYPDKEHGENTTYPNYSYSQKWTIDGVEQEPLTTGGNVKFELVENYNPDYYDVSVNEETGEIYAPTHINDDGTALDHSINLMLCRVKMTVTLNGASAEATADVVAKGNDMGVEV